MAMIATSACHYSLLTAHYSLRILPATDKLHDLVAIAFHNARFAPIRARQDLPISFDGNTSAVNAKHLQQLTHRHAGRCFACFAIHYDGNISAHTFHSRRNTQARGFARS